jgi:predicted small secreted protein
MTNQTYATTIAVALAILATTACGNTMRGIKTDTETNVEKTVAGVETMDVKAALIADGRVDAGNINVDTSASTKTVVLKGSVPTDEQRTTAEAIARDQAKGYTITNNLTVAPSSNGAARTSRRAATALLGCTRSAGL